MNWYIAALVPISLFLEIGISNYLKIGGVKPDVALIVVIMSGLLFGATTGGTIGFCAGMLQDLLLGQYIGAFGLTRCVAGILSGLIGTVVFKENPLLAPLLTYGMSVFCDLMLIGLLYFLGIEIISISSMSRLVVYAGLYNAVLAHPVALMIKRLRLKSAMGLGFRLR